MNWLDNAATTQKPLAVLETITAIMTFIGFTYGVAIIGEAVVKPFKLSMVGLEGFFTRGTTTV